MHKDALVKLLRFESTLAEKGKPASLADYVSRMKEGQKEIYFLTGPSRDALEAGPYLEGFRARNLEVLLCTEPVDDYVMNHVREFEGKKLIAADSTEVKLDELPRPPDGDALPPEKISALVEWLKKTLGDRVTEVRASDRLVDSPAAALNADKLMSPQMRRMMKAMNKDGADAPPRVELVVNPRHAVIKRLAAMQEASPERAVLVAEQLLDNSLLAASLLDDPTKMVARLYKILESA
jgi:TNF receptor-associated protein 1